MNHMSHLSHALGLPILATKLMLPRLRQGLVTRTRLARLLDAAAVQPFTLVSAPAGFGKTTVVAAWAQEGPLPVAWLSLDAADNDPARFLRYLVAALQTLHPAFGRDLHAAIEAGHAPPIERAVITLINELAALPTECLLVIDDFHQIDQGAIEAALQTLVEHQPPQFHLLIATREDPPLPLARLRARGQLVELRAGDLRFTPAETAAFLRQVMGLDLTPQQVAELDAHIEGWVAGLQLAGLSLQRSGDPAALIGGLSGGHHFILTYLTEEVLRRQPPEVQDFLLQTSILDRLCGSLCDAVCERDDSAAVLAHLYAANAFVVPLDDEHIWFRYHPLFRELLHSQLQRTRPDLLPVLHRRAAGWFEAQAQPSEIVAAEAIDHTLAAGDHAHAVALLEQHARPLVLRGYAETVAGWLRRLPPEWRAGGPQANVAFAWSLLLRGQLSEIEGYLTDAEAALERGEYAAAPDAQAGLRAEILALRAGLVSLRGDTETACRMARTAIESAPPGDLYVQGATRFCLATACNYAGRTVEAMAAYQEALPLCRASGNLVAARLIVANLTLLMIDRGQLHAAADLSRATIAAAAQAGAPHSPTLASVYGAHAYVLYEWNDLPAAQAEAQQALELGRRSGHVAAVAYGCVMLSRIQTARGELEAAAQLLAESLALRTRGMPAWVFGRTVSQQVNLALAREDERAAEEALAGSGVAADAPTDHTREVIHLAHLRLLLHRLLHQLKGPPPAGAARAAQFAQAHELAGRIIASAEVGGRVGRVIEALVLRAPLWQAQGRAAAAQDDIGRALALAEPGGYVRVFTEQDAAMARLLASFAPPPNLQPYVKRLIATLPAPAETAAPEPVPSSPAPLVEPLVEPLSERELEVLRLMAEGLTYQAVAARLIVSVNTVRFHVKSIYGKLGVDNRTAALEQARALHLLT